MEAVVWSDYICPWCYFGRDRTLLLRSMGVAVTTLPYELHPETPLAGVALGSRTRDRFRRIQAEVGAEQVPFEVPARSPNSRLALETAEAVRRLSPAAFGALDDALFRAHFVEGDDIGDEVVLRRLLVGTGADVDAVAAAVAGGDARQWVDESRAAALDAGVTGTPAWLVDGRLLIPGVQSRETFERLVTRMLSRRR